MKGSRGNTFVGENGMSWGGVGLSHSVLASRRDCSRYRILAGREIIRRVYDSQGSLPNGQRCQVDSYQAQRVHLALGRYLIGTSSV